MQPIASASESSTVRSNDSMAARSPRLAAASNLSNSPRVNKRSFTVIPERGVDPEVECGMCVIQTVLFKRVR